MQVGDLVLVTFPFDSPEIGIFMGITIWDDLPGLPEEAPTRADVFWGGEMISTPVDQIEAING